MPAGFIYRASSDGSALGGGFAVVVQGEPQHLGGGTTPGPVAVVGRHTVLPSEPCFAERVFSGVRCTGRPQIAPTPGPCGRGEVLVGSHLAGELWLEGGDQTHPPLTWRPQEVASMGVGLLCLGAPWWC